MVETTLRFLGTSACIPDTDNDTASYLVNGECLIDTGWHVTQTLRRGGKTPADIKALLITHLHHDHIMALPALLYERYCAGDACEMHVFGPEGVEEAIRNADMHLQKSVYWPDVQGPQVHTLCGTEEFDIGRLHVKTMRSVHAVRGLCYCIEDSATGRSLGFPGDGEPQQEQVAFFCGCDVLTHEFSLGLSKKAGHRTRHSSIWDALAMAQETGAGMLCPVHGPARIVRERGQELVGLYSGNLHWPGPNELLVFGPK